ncbi:MAG: hypothetical protein HWD59_10590 [Coxiellaceae bacterium]|nr:MAG: hypothetical protein HWD59_10590 [Coxiellaceae bacterium]
MKNKFVENNLTAGYAKESDFELITLSDPRELVRALKKSKYLDENGRLQKHD